MKLADVILGFVQINPGISGYLLGKLDESGMGYYFSAKRSQIYPLLNELEADGYITHTTDESVGQRSRFSYYITDAGREYLKDTLLAVRNPKHQLVDFRASYLRLMFLNSFEGTEVDEFLSLWLKELTTTYELMRERFPNNMADYIGSHIEPSKLFIYEDMARFSLEDLRAKIDWISSLIEARRYSPDRPPPTQR